MAKHLEMSQQSDGRQWGGALFGGFWILFWSSITLGFCSMLVYNGWRQMVAMGYPTAPAVITHSEVKHHDESSRVELKYRIDFDGREVIGTRRRYNETASNDGWAEDAIRNYPVGKQVTAYYPPHAPEEAILEPGLEGMDLFMALFLTPFVVVMLFGWAIAWNWLRGSRSTRPAAGLKLTDRGDQLSIRLERHSALAVALVTLAVLAFVLIFALGFISGFHPSLDLMRIVWAGALAIVAVVYVIAAWRGWTGQQELVLDRLNGQIELPAMFGRPAPLTVPLDDVTGVAVEHHASPDQKRTNHQPNAVTLYHRTPSGSTRGERLVEFLHASRAEAFAEWLREALRSAGRGSF